MGQKISGFIYQLTQAEVSAGIANDLSGGLIEIVDNLGMPTGSLMATSIAGMSPTIIKTDSNTSKNKIDAVIAPTLADGVSNGFTVGSRWIDIEHNESYLLVSLGFAGATWSNTTVGTIAEVAGLQTELNSKEPTLSRFSKDILNNVEEVFERSIPNFTAADVTGVAGLYKVSASSTFSGWTLWGAVKEELSVGSFAPWTAATRMGTPIWYQIEFPTPRAFRGVQIASRNSTGPAAGWEVQGSKDGANWDTLFIGSEDMGIVLKEHIFPSNMNYSFCRMFSEVTLGNTAGLSAFWPLVSKFSFNIPQV